ncbi:MAG: hypothetical protein K6F64_00070 [Clostridia bacterium]|nr:hypothetical protein [Clostridia bacterium]
MKKIIAVMMALAIVLSFAACGAKENAETTAATEATEPEIATEATEATETASQTEESLTDESAASEEATEASTAAESESSTEATEAETTTEKETESTTEAKKAPEGKAEIVKYFNESINKVKPDAKSITQNYSKITLAGSMTLPSAINGVLRLLGGADKFIGDQLAKNSKGKEVLSDKKAFPVENETWSSKLTEGDVKSATCTEKDGVYTITITTVADGKSSSVTHGQGHAPKAFNVVLPGVVNDNIPGVAAGIVGTAAMNYPSSTVKVTVDAETGHVLTAVYDSYWTINFDKAGVVIPFLTSTSYNIAW